MDCVQSNHIAVKAYQVPTCTGTRSTILLRLVCGRTPVATLGMWADPGRALSVGSGAKRRVGSDIGTASSIGNQYYTVLSTVQYITGASQFGWRLTG
eukprot:COSAG02_NODE_899_length_16096_cov_19.762956_5_plen_97_part_00